MAEHLDIVQGTKNEKYEALYPQIEAVLNAETDLIATFDETDRMWLEKIVQLF